MKLLIVDDESFIRQSIAEYFAHSDYGFDEVLCAEDGSQGLAIVEKSCPEIIISDVVMPGISGLEFVQKVKETHPDCEALMISGHEESAYIRQALKFDAIDYLLKPIDIDELDNVIQKIMCRIRTRQEEKRTWSEMEERIRESRGLWVSRLFESISGRTYFDREEVRQQLAAVGSALDPDEPVAAVYMCVDECLEGMEFHDRQTVQISLLAAAEHEITARGLQALASLHGADLLGILVNADGADAVESLAGAIRQKINETLRKTVAVGIGNSAANAFEAQDSCRSARAALIEATLGGRNRVVRASALPTDSKAFSPVSNALDWMQGLYDNANVSLLRKLISENYADWLKDKVDALQRELNERRADTSKRIVDMATDIIGKRYGSPINLQTAADEIGITPNYLSAIFKDAVGENFTVILTRKRLEAAVELLENSDEPIARISEITGFGDCNYFGKVFKKAYSITPGAYRKRVQP